MDYKDIDGNKTGYVPETFGNGLSELYGRNLFDVNPEICHTKDVLNYARLLLMDSYGIRADNIDVFISPTDFYCSVRARIISVFGSDKRNFTVEIPLFFGEVEDQITLPAKGKWLADAISAECCKMTTIHSWSCSAAEKVSNSIDEIRREVLTQDQWDEQVPMSTVDHFRKKHSPDTIDGKNIKREKTVVKIQNGSVDKYYNPDGTEKTKKWWEIWK